MDALLVVGGRFHDMDFARLQLLQLLAEHDRVRTHVAADFRDLDALARADLLVTYTCDVRPSEAEQEALAAWVGAGGRWLALHGTNAALTFTPEGVEAPDVFPRLVEVLGSRFVAHPPIEPYEVRPVEPAHPLVAGIPPFTTTDELYLSEEADGLVPLLATRFGGRAPGFLVDDWGEERDRLCAYLRPWGEGCTCYVTLGHCRGHLDMQPVMDRYPVVERGSWELPEYRELLRRCLAWAVDRLPVHV